RNAETHNRTMPKSSDRLTPDQVRQLHSQTVAAFQTELARENAGVDAADAKTQMGASCEQRPLQFFGDLRPKLQGRYDRDIELSRLTEERTKIVFSEVLHLIAYEGERLSLILRNDIARHRGELQLSKEQIAEGMGVVPQATFGQSNDQPPLLLHY